MQKWLLIICMLMLTPAWAGAKHDIVSVQPNEAIVAADCLQEDDNYSTTAEDEHDGPDGIIMGWHILPNDVLQESYLTYKEHTHSVRYINSGIRAPPFLTFLS